MDTLPDAAVELEVERYQEHHHLAKVGLVEALLALEPRPPCAGCGGASRLFSPAEAGLIVGVLRWITNPEMDPLATLDALREVVTAYGVFLPRCSCDPYEFLPPRGFCLYRLWGVEDRLLYVGISENVRGRVKQHLQRDDWGCHVRRVTVDGDFLDRASLLAAEREAIQSEHPAFNRAGLD